MNKTKFLVIFMISILLTGIFIFNMEVTTRQGINYKVYTLKIPLYLKILDFYDRHYNYKWLAHKITKDKTNDEVKVLAIFNWVVENVAEQPKAIRVMDDHVWHIIVRGYGTNDQFSDVFTTLCNYAHFDAFFLRLYDKGETSRIPFSFVKITNKWYIFDPYAGVYFTKKGNTLATLEDIARGDWVTRNIKNLNKPIANYADYFSEILSIDFEGAHKMARANIQSPINRLIYGIRKK